MGRPPVGKKAMTDAERQKRRRKRLAKTRTAEWKELEALKRREKNARGYIPSPPGVTYWRSIPLAEYLERHGAIFPMKPAASDDMVIWQPETKPLAAVNRHGLEDADIRHLLRSLARDALRRGLDPAQIVCDPGTDAGITQATGEALRPLREGESCTIGEAL